MSLIQIRFVSIIYATNSKTYERQRDINFPTEDPRLTMILQAVSLSYSGEKTMIENIILILGRENDRA